MYISKAMAKRRDGPTIAEVFAAALVAVLASLPSRADTIHLKNGHVIQARVVRQDAKQVECESDGNEFTIPRDLVDHIDASAGDDAPQASPALESKNARALPLPEPQAVSSTPADAQVINSGAVNNGYLAQLDGLVRDHPTVGNRRRLDHAYQQAAIFLTQQGKPEEAIAEYQHALSLDPDDLALTLGLAYSLIKQSHEWEAIRTLLPAEDRYPRSPDVPMLLGSAYYGMEDLDRAIAEWKKALALHASARLREALAQVEKERSVAGDFQELRSQHFLLSYGDEEPRDFVQQVINTLENAWLGVGGDLNYYPQEPIVVILYPNQAFRDITRMPSWVGAINDGKIRLPVSGLTVVTPDIARILRHELTHSFVYQITMGRCPVWFNEGLAQLEEGATTAALGSQLTRAFATLPPFSALEGSFLKLPAASVGMTYAKSLAALEYLRDTYGLGEIQRLLQEMPSHSSFESLLEDDLNTNYAQFEQEVANYVFKRYGS